jgi:hypothetical protein
MTLVPGDAPLYFTDPSTRKVQTPIAPLASSIFSCVIGPRSKYPPAEPGALVLEPLKTADPCGSNPASLLLCVIPHQVRVVALGKPSCLLLFAPPRSVP